MDTALDHLEQSLGIPVLDGLQAQGDLIVIPTALLATPPRLVAEPRWEDVPPEGIVLLRSAGGGNPHTLVAEPGTCRWTSVTYDPVSLGVFETSAIAYLLHPEHGASGCAPGTYLVRRQREHDRYRGGSRLVAD